MEPKDVKKGYEPKFRDPSTLPPEALTDPDYRLKQLQKVAEQMGFGITDFACSRCHHCR